MGDLFERVAGQAVCRPLILRPGAQRLVKRDGRFIPVEDGPLDAAAAPVSLNRAIGSEEEGELGDLFSDPNAEDPAEEAIDTMRRDEVRRAVAVLPELERRIIERRFGLDGEPASLEAVGQELGVTPRRVHQLQDEALARLADELDLASAA